MTVADKNKPINDEFENDLIAVIDGFADFSTFCRGLFQGSQLAPAADLKDGSYDYAPIEAFIWIRHAHFLSI